MALVQRKISKGKQFRLVGALALVIAITALVAYYGLLRKPTLSPPPTSASARADSARSKIPDQTGYEAAQELSESRLYRALRSFGIWPLSSEPKGNPTPFGLRETEEGGEE